MGMESPDVVRFNLGPLLRGQMRITKLKSAYNSINKMLFIFKTMSFYGGYILHHATDASLV